MLHLAAQVPVVPVRAGRGWPGLPAAALAAVLRLLEQEEVLSSQFLLHLSSFVHCTVLSEVPDLRLVVA